MKKWKDIWDGCDRKLFKANVHRMLTILWLFPLIQLLTCSFLVYVASTSSPSADSIPGALIYAAIAGIALSVGLVIALWSMVGHLYRKPLHIIDRLFRQMEEGRLDLSQNMEMLPYPELKHVHSGYNRFMEQIRVLIEHIRSMGVRIAIDSTTVRKTIDNTVAKTKQQTDLSEMVTISSNDANTAITELSQNAQYVSNKTTTNLENAKQSLKEFIDIREKFDQIIRTVNGFQETVQELSSNSASIMDIVGLINNISEETNLLSLNATIEAARAGEHGKGFAVVAEEVRTLAKRVKPATQDIAEKVNAMIATVEKTMAETETIMQFSSDVGQTINQTSQNFESMTHDLEGNNEQLLKIAAAIEELTVNNGEVNSKVSDIDRFAHEIDADMNSSEELVHGLNQATENMQEMVSQYKTGKGVLDQIITLVRHHRNTVQTKIAELKSAGTDIFDRNNRPIAGTQPQKYSTSYTDAFKKTFQAYVDDTLKTIPGAIYCLPVKDNGYLPVHHTPFSQPLTGDYEKDLLNSRDQRIYNNNPTEVRRAQSQAPMLLQTYMRDTGEVLNDLSMPITVDGKHWGALIVGLNPDVFLSGEESGSKAMNS